jgi:hypothetical protein
MLFLEIWFAWTITLRPEKHSVSVIINPLACEYIVNFYCHVRSDWNNQNNVTAVCKKVIKNREQNIRQE